MARPLRIQYQGAMYHVISRGNGRMTLFYTEKDWAEFHSFLERVFAKYNWVAHAWCLMGNHYHLLIETPDANMVPGMKQLNQFYSQFFNWKHRRTGSVLQGRYKAYLVEKESQFLENCRYVVNNPVKAGMVDHPSKWPWSSFNATRGLVRAPNFLNTDFLLSHFGSSRRDAQDRYESFVLAGVGEESPLKHAKGQIFLGSCAFIRKVMGHAGSPELVPDFPRKQRMASRPSLDDLFKEAVNLKKTRRNQNIKLAHETYRYTLREIGSHLNLHPDYLSRLLGDIRKTSEGRT